jgi:hypothetical protein
MRTVVTLAVVLLVGCGGDPPPHERILGSWTVRLNDAPVEDMYVSYHGDGTYRALLASPASANIAQVQAEEGSFTATDLVISQFPTKSSCPGPARPSVIAYRFVRANLVFDSSTGVIDFAATSQSQEPDKGGVLLYGCFNDGDPTKFTASPLIPVSGP